MCLSSFVELSLPFFGESTIIELHVLISFSLSPSPHPFSPFLGVVCLSMPIFFTCTPSKINESFGHCKNQGKRKTPRPKKNKHALRWTTPYKKKVFLCFHMHTKCIQIAYMRMRTHTQARTCMRMHMVVLCALRKVELEVHSNNNSNNNKNIKNWKENKNEQNERCRSERQKRNGRDISKATKERKKRKELYVLVCVIKQDMTQTLCLAELQIMFGQLKCGWFRKIQVSMTLLLVKQTHSRWAKHTYKEVSLYRYMTNIKRYSPLHIYTRSDGLLIQRLCMTTTDLCCGTTILYSVFNHHPGRSLISSASLYHLRCRW